MRALIVCDYFSARSSGGSERVAREVATRLSLAGVNIEVFSAVPRSWLPLSDDFSFPVDWHPATDLSSVVGAQLTVGRGLRPALRTAMQRFRPDVVHAQSLHFASTLAVASIVHDLQAALVTTAHLGSVAALPVRHRLPTQLYEGTAGRYILRRSTEVIAVSESVRAHVESIGAPREHVHVVLNGVDATSFAPRPAASSDEEPLRVAFTGRLIANKGVLLLLDAAALLEAQGAAVVIDIYGDGPLRSALEGQVRRDGLSNVRIHGHSNRLNELLPTADVLVRPSLTEGLPLGVLEGMAAGCAVVATDISGNSDLVTNGRSGLLIAPGDPTALARALNELAADRPRVRRMGAAGQQIAAKHSWDSCAKATLRVLRQAVATAATTTV